MQKPSCSARVSSASAVIAVSRSSGGSGFASPRVEFGVEVDEEVDGDHGARIGRIGCGDRDRVRPGPKRRQVFGRHAQHVRDHQDRHGSADRVDGVDRRFRVDRVEDVGHDPLDDRCQLGDPAHGEAPVDDASHRDVARRVDVENGFRPR